MARRLNRRLETLSPISPIQLIMRRFDGLLLFTFLFVSLCVPAWSRDLTRYAIVLTDPPAATVATRRDRPAMEAARNRIQSAHEPVKAELRRRNIQITGEAHTLLNAIFVAADPSQIDQLKALAGVSYVAKMPRYHLELDAAEQLINVPAAWSLLGGTSNAGAGIKIGIIDTGIENTHPAFQDSSLTPPSGFPICGVPADCAFTNNKIIVARSYVSLLAAGTGSNPAADSRPDDYSARDRFGHGTAVAMAAAGVTNTGPSDTIIGVAPKAFLGSYKVFGSPGVNGDYTTGDAIISAIEDAYDDGMDIVVLSLGAPAVYGPLDTGAICGQSRGQACDTQAFVVQSAVNAGMLVVAAAGNEGSTGSVQPSLGTIASPADAPAAIAVAATTNFHTFANALTVNGLGSYLSVFGSGPVPAGTFTGPLSDVASVGDPLGCNPVPANSLAGTIALVQRGTCTFVVKVQNLQVAGAIGVIFTNNAGDDSLVTAGGLNGTTIPAIFIGYHDGQTIRAYLKANPNATAGINPHLVPYSVSTWNQVASFSSRGPVLGASALKPDVAAVGTNLYLAAQNYDPNGVLYSANGYIVSQGTSFSTPQVAGVAALVMQAHSTLTALQVKSAVVNTATQDVTDSGLVASVLSVGAGKANAAAAVATNLIASPTSVSFGIIEAGVLPATQQIQLTNIGSAALTLSATITRRTTESTAHISIDLPNITIAPGQKGSVNLTLSGTTPAPGAYQGLVTFQGAANPFVIPFYYVVGDGVPYDIIPIVGNGDNGIVGQQNSEGGLLFQVLDQYGIPVANLPVKFAVSSGGGALSNSDQSTNSYGFARTNDTLGSTPGANVFTATAGGLSTTFTIAASLQPAINPKGAVNAAGDSLGQGFSPGSYVTLFGRNFTNVSQAFSTPYLPISINGVSVSFDTPSLSVPGGLWYVSAGQVNVQVPWELQQALQAGQTSARIKVNSGGNSGALYNLPLASYSPAFFESPVGFAAALDENNQVVTNSNPVAQGSVAQLFVNGLGPVTNQPASGAPAPASPRARTTVTPVVMIGGQPAGVQFSGLAPGNIGLYQVNVVVPATGAGLQPITISIGGVQSSTSHLAVK